MVSGPSASVGPTRPARRATVEGSIPSGLLSQESNFDHGLNQHLARPRSTNKPDRLVIPRGSQAVGRLIEVSAAGKTAGAKMSLVLTSVTVGGLRIQIETEALAMEAKSDTGRDAGRIIGGTAIGAIIGGIAGGGDGAGIGAIVGGGAGTAAAVLTRGRELEFEAEQEFHFTLAEPVNVRR
jgi:hypothetical protein